MGSLKEVFAVDSTLRAAMVIAELGGVPKEDLRFWCGELVLGEMTVEDFFDGLMSDRATGRASRGDT